MPIDYRNYNKDFKQTSRRIRFERAEGRCECCGVEHGEVGYWIDGKWWSFTRIEELLHNEGIDMSAKVPAHKKLTTIVLTTAHLDQSTTNDADENLRALCQKCHLDYDRPDNRDKRRYGPKGQHRHQIRLFIIPPAVRKPAFTTHAGDQYQNCPADPGTERA